MLQKVFLISINDYWFCCLSMGKMLHWFVCACYREISPRLHTCFCYVGRVGHKCCMYWFSCCKHRHALPTFYSEQGFVASNISFCYIGVVQNVTTFFATLRKFLTKWCLHFWKITQKKNCSGFFFQQWSGSTQACESNVAAKLHDASATLTPSARTTVSKVLVCDNCRSRPLFSIHKYKSVYYVCIVRIPTYWGLAPKENLWGACSSMGGNHISRSK